MEWVKGLESLRQLELEKVLVLALEFGLQLELESQLVLAQQRLPPYSTQASCRF